MALIETDIIKCKNCDADVDGSYCGNCGQKTIGRMSFKYVLTLLKNDLFDVDHGLIYTFTQLWKHPGRMVGSFINGRTKDFYSPLKYLIFWGALALILIQWQLSGAPPGKTMTELVFNDHSFFSGESFEDLANIYLIGLRDYTNLYYILLVPFLTIASGFIYYKKRYNIVELMTLYLYLSGQIVSVIVVGVLFSYVTGQDSIFFMGLSLMAVLYLTIRSHKELFDDNWFWTIIKSLGVLYAGQFLLFGFAYLVVNLMKLV
jgi:hypothetical protein